MQISEMIRKLLDVHEMSIPQLAEKAGLSQSTIRALLKDSRNAHLTTIIM